MQSRHTPYFTRGFAFEALFLLWAGVVRAEWACLPVPDRRRRCEPGYRFAWLNVGLIKPAGTAAKSHGGQREEVLSKRYPMIRASAQIGAIPPARAVPGNHFRRDGSPMSSTNGRLQSAIYRYRLPYHKFGVQQKTASAIKFPGA